MQDGTQSATTTAAPLNGGTSIVCQEVLVQNDPDNAVDVFVGNATSQSVQLRPGETYTALVNNVSKVYVKSASSTATVNWQARV